MGAFFDHLLDSIREENTEILAHTVVRGIGDGTLAPERFRFYLGQDYYFLRAYSRVLGLAAATADDLDDVKLMAALLHDTASVEMDAVGQLYSAFGGNAGELLSVSPTMSCSAYTDHLLAVAYRGNLLATIASLLPCQWGYRQIARSLAESRLPDDPRHLGWINEYLSTSYSDLVDRMIEALERAAAIEGSRAHGEAERVFAASGRHELNFWNMVLD